MEIDMCWELSKAHQTDVEASAYIERFPDVPAPTSLWSSYHMSGFRDLARTPRGSRLVDADLTRCPYRAPSIQSGPRQALVEFDDVSVYRNPRHSPASTGCPDRAQISQVNQTICCTWTGAIAGLVLDRRSYQVAFRRAVEIDLWEPLIMVDSGISNDALPQ
ncbi:hypothetical protein PUNSTDRAFT_134288 [Punctularia strigosozonata HHB-11173 SS5]|uniref:uncharacterized protein n=1 Tax=Punctularia strigosozonata (strain HHB-11173) TaxID=741275 RepID=UPI000441772D|nr:uncharacterized protein PUNSTDRAFT_134288 [Punctularia strigosozonata HHB-11173 SS5]EIN09121.1 hypothetical protein PUNSTDRAFT_134288 [Punctularia strigosozonata HHB-11173 SS5]